MSEQIDYEQIADNEPVGMGPRIAASIIDGVARMPFLVFVYMGVIDGQVWKIYLGLLCHILYRPILEGLHGSTLGKLVLKIKVVDRQGKPPGLVKDFLRSIFWIILGILSLPSYLKMLEVQGNGLVEKMMNMAIEQQESGGSMDIFSICNAVLSVVMIISLIIIETNSEKKGLHDKFSGTQVVKR